MFTIPEVKIKNQQEQQESQAHNTMLVTAISISIVDDNISHRPSVPKYIVEKNYRPDEAIL